MPERLPFRWKPDRGALERAFWGERASPLGSSPGQAAPDWPARGDLDVQLRRRALRGRLTLFAVGRARWERLFRAAPRFRPPAGFPRTLRRAGRKVATAAGARPVNVVNAATASGTPRLPRSFSMPPGNLHEDVMALSNSSAVAVGLACKSSAANPATCGVAMELPFKAT